jgi:hypothetical protein
MVVAYFEVPSIHLFGKAERSHEKPVMIAIFHADVQTQVFLSIKQGY